MTIIPGTPYTFVKLCSQYCIVETDDSEMDLIRTNNLLSQPFVFPTRQPLQSALPMCSVRSGSQKSTLSSKNILQVEMQSAGSRCDVDSFFGIHARRKLIFVH